MNAIDALILAHRDLEREVNALGILLNCINVKGNGLSAYDCERISRRGEGAMNALERFETGLTMVQRAQGVG